MHTVNCVVNYWKPFFWAFLLLTITCLTSNLVVLPITGLYLVGYLLMVVALSTWATFVIVQNFLHQNKPVDLPKKLFNWRVNINEKVTTSYPCSVKQLTVDIDEHFVRKWFVYITKDETFNVECRLVLEEVLRKIVNVQLGLDNEALIHGVLNLYLKHLKEFRRGLKRRDKYSGKISDLYRYSHVCSTSKKAKHYFVHRLTCNLLNHFINWELGNSLPYQIVVSIISKKLTNYVINLLSSPEFLNYGILSICASARYKENLNLSKFNRIKILQITEDGELTPTDPGKSPSKSNIDMVETPKFEQRPVIDSPKKTQIDFTEIKTEEVKIHEPKSCKTWYDSLDLTSIPLGQDILNTMGGDSDNEGDIGVDSQKGETSSPITSAKQLLDEMKHITTLEGFKTSMKPISEATVTTFHNIKEIQESTVNSVVKPVTQVTSSAFHKIGGLHLQDEAAGVVEGILDFGRTRIRKGLRLTGLQDSPVEEVKPVKKLITKMSHVKSVEKGDEAETTWINPLQEDPPPKLFVDQKNMPKIPSIQTQDEGSPEPEYEEAADLATSIAKLRSLLEQKSSESNMSTPALSPMPTDELSGKVLLELGETDGVMPSFYKFCAKTATGVIHNTLNTIKTALPGNINDLDRFDGSDRWLFVEANTSDSDLFNRMNKLLCERKVFCTVDTAYEALDSLQSLQGADKLRPPNIYYEDELDDFEVKLPISKALFDILCELLADSKDTSLTQEPVIKSILLLFGNYIEESVISYANYYVQYGCANAKIPVESNIETLSMELDEFMDGVLSGIPDYVRYMLGEKTLRDGVNLFISSLQVQKINQDFVMQVFEIITMKLMDGSKQLSPISA